MADLVDIQVTGIEEIQEKLSQLPDAAADAGVEAANEYIIDVMRLYPPRVNHKTKRYIWNSEKQRRAFFATNGFGRGIPTRRTQQLASSWETVGKGKEQAILSTAEYADYVVGNKMQHGHVADGWSSVKMTIRERTEKIIRKFDAGVKNAIKRLGLG